MITKLNKLIQKPIDSNESTKYYSPWLGDVSNSEVRLRMCDYTSIVNYHLCGLEMNWGTVWLWDNSIKSYKSVYFHHVWNEDELGNILDDFDSINHVISLVNSTGSKIHIDPEKDGYRKYDGDKIRVTSNFEKDEERIGKYLKDIFSKPLFTPKVIFVTNVGWDKNRNPFTWDVMEERWNEIEMNQISRDIQLGNVG